MTEINQTIRKALSEDPQRIAFEEIPGEESSPLNQPVAEKDFTANRLEDQEFADFQPSEVDNQDGAQAIPDSPLDAPEQEINDHPDGEFHEEEAFEIPPGHARQAADAFLGIADNVLEVGGGFFVKIRKVKAFYDFDQIIQVIEQQNAKNVKRIKLDQEDKILLRPLLIAILKKRAQKLSVEQQFMGALLSVLMKKVQMIVEVRTENEELVERIIDIIKQQQEEPSEVTSEKEETAEEEPTAEKDKVTSDPAIATDAIIEVAEEDSLE